jgi:hypothetical protein
MLHSPCPYVDSAMRSCWSQRVVLAALWKAVQPLGEACLDCCDPPKISVGLQMLTCSVPMLTAANAEPARVPSGVVLAALCEAP